ncbi:MAG: hypothetical protein LBG72_10480 [Spirochaetaceae bacterium]|jgi:hypothetical protein|nr:hypothetical protein [Spirochaetaceae bacterium]
MPKKTHPISELDARMDPEVLARAKKMAQEESLNVRLAILREKYGVKQNEITAFTQTAVSKLENRIAIVRSPYSGTEQAIRDPEAASHFPLP